MQSEALWLKKLKPSVLNFLSQLESKDRPGFYKYSLSGDLYNDDVLWGLGNAVFASKILYILNKKSKERDNQLADFINKFSNKAGYIYDPFIHKLSNLSRLKQSLINFNPEFFINEKTKRAETRQAFAALACLKSKPDNPFLHIPYSTNEVDSFLQKLDWQNPWDAGSHFSHLLFFLHHNAKFFDYKKKKTNKLINFSIDWLNQIQSQVDGSWHINKSSTQQKINGAMKVLTGLNTIGFYDINYKNQLIDFCLKSINDLQACDNINIIYVLNYCSKDNNYRKNDIKQFLIKRLKIYKKYYYPKIGGFSFYKNSANQNYYGAKISQGLNEPDIHGTLMFLWGISLISETLNLDLNLRHPIT
jgi:hypothetical protein